MKKAELLACVDREIGFRAHVYPRRVAAGKMTQDLANRELFNMRAVRDALAKHVPDDVEAQASLFGDRGRRA